MKRVFEFGKIAYEGERKENLVTVEVGLQKKKEGYVFSACCCVWNKNKTDIFRGGQCFDGLLQYINQLDDKKLFVEIWELWKKWHLNDMHAGTEKQEKALKNFNGDYKAQCEYLEKKGLLIDDGYKYGTSWLFRKIDKNDLIRIAKIMEINPETF
jgi:hypothetical protein